MEAGRKMHVCFTEVKAADFYSLCNLGSRVVQVQKKLPMG